MSFLKRHIEISKVRTGKDYREVHEWMDGRINSIKDILSRHNVLRVSAYLPVVEKKFGKDGAHEYLFHLRDDYKTHLFLILWKKIVKILIKMNRIRFSQLDDYQKEVLFSSK